MGCCVSKSTYLSYQKELSNTTVLLDELESKIERRKMENDIEEIDESERADYLAYQEQIRSRNILKSLSQYIPIKHDDNSSVPAALDTNQYFKLVYKQTEDARQITNKLESIILEITRIHDEKKKEIENRMQIVSEFAIKEIENGEKQIKIINDKIIESSSIHCLNDLVDSVIKLSEIQKDLELLKRRCDYKHYLLEKQEKIKAKADALIKIEELKKHIDSLNAN